MKENFSMLRAESAPDSITLYWDRPQGRLGTTYEIFLKDTNHTEADFTLVGSTQKTHYTIENLQENTRYEILLKGIYQVDMALIEDGSKSVQIEKEIKQQTITMHTFNRSDFSPSPKVDTVLLHLKQKKNTLSLSEYKDFKDLVAYFYSQGKGKSSKDRLAVLFSNAQIRRLCKDNNINLLDSYTKITSEQWMNVFLYSRIGLTAEKKRLVGDAYKKLEKINKGLQKQNRTYLRKPSQSNSKSSTFNRRQKSLN